jgi:hypothetical protein
MNDPLRKLTAVTNRAARGVFAALLLVCSTGCVNSFLHGGRFAKSRDDEATVLRHYKMGHCWGIPGASPDYFVIQTKKGSACYSRTHAGHGIVTFNSWKSAEGTNYFSFVNVDNAGSLRVSSDETGNGAERCVIPDDPRAKGREYWYGGVTVQEANDVYTPVTAPQGECELIPVDK